MTDFGNGLIRQVGTRLAGWAASLALIGVSACGDITGPTVDARPEADSAQSRRVLYSLTAGGADALETMVTGAEEDEGGTRGPRWCSVVDIRWVDPSLEGCGGRRETRPLGEVTITEDGVLLSAGVLHAAPFIWTGSPGRVNPFPEDRDFDLTVRLTVKQIAVHGTGVWVSRWDPARTDSASNPLTRPILRIWVDSRGLRAFLFNTGISLSDRLATHEYRLTLEGGAYSLYIDGSRVAGPVTREVRPTAIWLGNPLFAYWGRNDWSDLLISEVTVSVAADESIEVPVDVKPGGCPAAFPLGARGVLPVAVAGTADFDVSRVDPATIRLEGVEPLRHAFEDVTAPVQPYTGKTAADCAAAAAAGPDGVADLTLKFDARAVAGAIADAVDGELRTLRLTGNLLPDFGGTAIIGEDIVVIRAGKRR